MSIVVLAEKPSVARDIARVLGANQRANGYIFNNQYVITWALGHLVHFAEPNDYGGLWAQRWSFQQLPMIPENWIMKPIERTVDQFRIVDKLMNDPKTTEIICATDAGREGENIFRLIYEHSGCTKPFKRLWVSSLTDEALGEGLANLHDGAAFDDLARAAKARAQADWLVGLNMTRAYTVRNRALYTIGRVQTPTLGMIVAREILITKFEKVFYYEIEAGFEEGFRAKYLHTEEKGKETRIDAKPLAERLHQRFKEQETGKVLSVTKRTKKHNPPQLYDLINLQKDANRRFNLTASETLATAQKLYEQYKLITYPRTESRHISEDMLPQLPRILSNLNHPLAQEALKRLNEGHKLSKQYVDKTKLSDHHGIIPTPRRAPATLPRDMQNIYDLVVTRFVSIFLPEHKVEETTVLVDIDGAKFRAKGSVVLQEGWKEAEPKRKEKDGDKRGLPPLKKDQIVQINAMELLEKETAPPKRFTDSTLLTAMKNAGKEVEDDALAQAMKEQGLGTPATRAEIIEKLIRTRLVERKKKVIYPTEKGMALISVVHDMLKSPELTGKWEQKLKDVENGEYSVDRFNHAIQTFVTKLIPRVAQSPILSYRDPDRKGPKNKPQPPPGQPAKTSDSAAQTENSGFGTCPRCKQGSIIMGRAAYGCNRFRQGCQFTFPKEFHGKKLRETQVKDLVSKGKTSVIQGFEDAEGKFGGRLIMGDDQSIHIKRVAAKKKPEINELPCPKCGQGTIMEGNRGYGCNRFRDGCKFVVWKVFAEKKLTEIQVRALLTKGKTSKITGFVHNGEKVSAKLVLDELKQVTLELV